MGLTIGRSGVGGWGAQRKGLRGHSDSGNSGAAFTLSVSWGERTADGVAAGRGSTDGERAQGASWGEGTGGDAQWDLSMGRGSWVDQMSEMSLSGQRDSIPQEGGRNARVRRAVRISSLVAQEVSCV